MKALVRVELTRLRWRRAVLLLVAVAVLVPALVAGSRILDTRPIPEGDLAAVRHQAADQIASCERRPRQFGLSRDSADQCAEMIAGWHTGRMPLRMPEELGTAVGLTTVLAMLMVLLGTTFVGHDWNSGSMSNQLLFEPRRVRVWLAKGFVVTLVGAAVSLVVLEAFWLLLWAVARSRDIPVSREILLDGLQLGLRGALLAGAAALGGYALTMLFRSTVATVGVLFAVAVASGVLIAAFGLDGRWLPTTNVEAFARNGTTYYQEPPESCFRRERPAKTPDCDPERRLSGLHGAGYFGGLLLLASVPSLLSFRRRDVP